MEAYGCRQVSLGIAEIRDPWRNELKTKLLRPKPKVFDG